MRCPSVCFPQHCPAFMNALCLLSVHPALGSPGQERHVGAGPEKGHENGQRARAPLMKTG